MTLSPVPPPSFEDLRSIGSSTSRNPISRAAARTVMTVMLVGALLPMLAPSALANEGDLEWVDPAGGTSTDYVIGLSVGDHDSIIATGAFSATVDFDPGVDITNLTSNGETDAFVWKLDGNGLLLWARQAGGSGSDLGRGVTVDGQGNIIVAGQFRGTVDFDPGLGTVSLTSNGAEDAFVWKLDPDGLLLWARQAGGTLIDAAQAVAVDGDDNILVAGGLQGVVDFDPGVGTTILTSNGATDGFVWKLDPDGNLLWVRQAGSAGSDPALGVAVDGNDNAAVTGYFQGTVDFDPGVGTANLTSSGGNDVFAWKLDSDGNLVWARQAGGTLSDVGLGVAIDGDDNVLSTGWFQGMVDFDPGVGTTNLSSNGATDAFVWKLDPAGDLVWARQAGGTGATTGAALAADALGIWVTGGFSGTTDFASSPNIADLTSSGSDDAFVWRLGADGSLLMVGQAGGGGSDVADAVATPADGSVVIGGAFSGTADFDPGPGVTNLTSNGGVDAFVWKLDGTPDGDLDGIADDSDNCPAYANPSQADFDFDGIGDVCDGTTDMHRVAVRLIARLQALNATFGNEHVTMAIGHLTDSLSSWAADQFTDAPAGHAAFEAYALAAEELVAAHQDAIAAGNNDGADALAGILAILVEGSERLAQEAINDAVARSGDPASIGTAFDEMAAAAVERGAGGPQAAIAHYEQAWEEAYTAT